MMLWGIYFQETYYTYTHTVYSEMINASYMLPMQLSFQFSVVNSVVYSNDLGSMLESNVLSPNMSEYAG